MDFGKQWKVHKARWVVTLAAAGLACAALVAEATGCFMTEGLQSMRSHPIARMLAEGNALTIVP